MKRSFSLSLGFAAAVTLGAVFFFASQSSAQDKKSQEAERLERRQKVEVMSFFAKDPKSAKFPTAPISVELFNQAVEYYKKGELALAKQTVKDSIAQNQMNPFAYELLGDIYNNEQDLKEAKSNYEIAYNLQPRAELKQKLEVLGREVKVDKKLSTYREEHFIIKYHNEEKQLEGFELRELLRETYRKISQDLGYYLKHQVVVQLLDEEEFKTLANTPHWAGGVYDGKVRLPVKKFNFSETDLKALAAHEVTHAFVASIASQSAPVWLNEGLATYQENKRRKIDLLVFKAAIKTNTVFPLDRLMSEADLSAHQDPLWVSLFYQQSFLLTSYLVKRYGMFHVKKLLTEFSKGSNAEEAVRNVLQISIPRLEKEWRASF